MLDIKDIKENESLRLHTTYKVGGVAKYFISTENIDELIKLVKYLKERSI